MIIMNRRHFLLSSAGALTAASQAHAASPRNRLAVTSWPFRAYIETPANRNRDPKVPGMDLKDFPEFVAEKFAVFNINPLGDHFHSTDPAYLEAFRASVEKARSHLVDLGLGGRKFYDPDAAVRQSAVDFGRKWIDIAVAIGSPSVRQHLADSKGAKRDPALAESSLAELAEYAAKRNIIVNLENDAAIAEDPFFLVEVIGKVNSPHLRALPDFGNSLPTYGQTRNQEAVTGMFKYAGNMCHVKDSVQSEDGQVHRVDLAGMFAIAKASVYRGYFSMEFDTNAGDPVTGTKQLIDQTLKYLS